VLFVTTASAQDPQREKTLCFEESACKWCHALGLWRVTWICNGDEAKCVEFNCVIECV